MKSALQTTLLCTRSGPGLLSWRSAGLLLAPAAIILTMACSGGGGGGGSTNPNTAPVITTQPADLPIDGNTAASFTVAASGSPAPTFTWERSNDSGSSWTTISGATAATYTFTAHKADHNAQFRATATNIVSTATSNPATLTIERWLEFTAQPANRTVTEGATASFSVTTDASPAITSLQWQSSPDGSTWTDVTTGTGGTTATYVTAATATGDTGTHFRCAATNATGTVNSDPATLTVNAAVAPLITEDPASQTIVAGNPVSFTVAASGDPAPTFSWERSNDNGGTWGPVGTASATYTFTAQKADHNAQFRATATNIASPAATSDAAILTMNWLEITTPADKTVSEGATASFTVTPDANPAVTSLQWQSSPDGSTWTDVTTGTGDTTATYVTAATVPEDTGTQFRCAATSTLGTIYSNPATLTVNPLAEPTITTHPATQTVNANASVSFTAAASGNPAPTFTWERSNNGGSSWTTITGATSATYTYTAILTDNAAQFRAIASNGIGTDATSNAATLTVTPVLDYTLTFDDASNPGTPVSLVLEPILAGSFEMGSPNPADLRANPKHTVTFAKPFYMAKFECTQAQWQGVMGTNPAIYNTDVQRPVENVSYEDITTAVTGFLAKLNAATASSRPAGMAFRLPTEAEWEYACRAGSTTNFYYGDDDDANPTSLAMYAWYNDNTPTKLTSPQPVGAKMANAWNLYDMAGNVWELCEDDEHYDYNNVEPGGAVPVRPDDGTAWIDTPRTSSRAARGGSWSTQSAKCQSFNRGFSPITNLDGDDGFRVVLALVP